jgi:type VI secretion system protein ImpI
MPRGVRIAVYKSDKRTWDVFDFAQLPIRFGRNKLNDVQLEDGGVSQFHAVLEVHGGQLAVRDVGSLNGTVVQGVGRLPPNTPTGIGQVHGEFVIVSFLVRAQVVELPEEEPAREPYSSVTEHNVRPQESLQQRLDPLYKQYRHAWSELFEMLHDSLGMMDDEQRVSVCDHLAKAMPGITVEPDFNNLRNPIPVEEGSIVSTKSPAAKSAVALQALGQLAATYFPNGTHSLDTPEDLALFVQNLRETLDVFLRCFIPLREGLRALTTQLELPTGRTDAWAPPTNKAAPGVEDAITPEDLAAALLDWRRPKRPEARQSIEWVFADLMIHQMAMVTGVMQGVKSLLSELSPPAIERTLEDPRKNPGGLQIGPFRYKQLWELYAVRHADLAQEDREAFAVIFGPEFARAYTGLANDTVAARSMADYASLTGRTPSLRPPRT